MNKTYLHSSCTLSTSKSMSGMAPFSHSQKLDLLLNELEAEYGLNSKTKLDTNNDKAASDFENNNKKNYNDDEIDQEGLKVWELAKSIKKHNASYRTAAKLLRELQAQQRTGSKGLLPVSLTASTTSCSSLEDYDLLLHQVKAASNNNKCQKSATPFSNTNKRVVVNHYQQQQHNKKASASEVILQSSKPKGLQTRQDPPKPAAVVVVEKPIVQPPPPTPSKEIIRFATPTLASTAKVKPKSNLFTVNCPMKNLDTCVKDCQQKSITNNETNNVARPLLPKREVNLNVNPSRIPTLSSRTKLTLSQLALVSTGKLSPPKNTVMSQAVEQVVTKTPPSVLMSKPISKQFNPSKINSDAKMKLCYSLANQEPIVPEKPSTIPPENDNSYALGIIRGLLEHAKSAVTTLFDINSDEESGESDQDSSATFIVDDDDAKSKMFQPCKEIQQAESDAKRREITPSQMIFGVPYVPGASKIPRPTYLP